MELKIKDRLLHRSAAPKVEAPNVPVVEATLAEPAVKDLGKDVWVPSDDTGEIPKPEVAGKHSFIEKALGFVVHHLDKHGNTTDRMPTATGQSGEWLVFLNHTHSTLWDGKVSLGDMIKTATAEGVDAMAITDHNTMRGAATPEFQNAPITMIKGEEWGAYREIGEEVLGHAGLLGMEGMHNIPPHSSIDQMLAEATSRKATIIINHPFNKGNSWHQAKPDPRANGIEVWNHLWYGFEPIMPNDKARDWWNEALVEGHRFTAIGGTDSHGNAYDELNHPVNLVLARENTPEAILQAVRDGHVTVMHDAHAARMVLEADDNGDGVYETVQGDALHAHDVHRTHMRVRVLGGEGQTVEFYGKRGLLTTAKVASNDATLPLDVVAMPGQQDFVRAELKKHPGKTWSMTAISNPIYLQ